MTLFFYALAVGAFGIRLFYAQNSPTRDESGHTLFEAEKVTIPPDRQGVGIGWVLRNNSADDKDFIHRPASKMSLTVPQRNLDLVDETLIWIKLSDIPPPARHVR